MTKLAMNGQRWVALAVVAMVCSGCATQPTKALSNLREVSLEAAEAPPRQDWIEGRGVKVAVDATKANQALLSAIARSVLESGSDAGGRFDGPAVAHFAVTPTISEWSLHSRLRGRGELSFFFPKGDPPVYVHAAAVEGWIRIQEIPGMRELGTLHFKERQTEENTAEKIAEPEARLREVFEKAYLRVRNDFKNLIAPRGAVVKRGISDNGTVFQVMIGAEHNVVPLDTVKIYAGAGWGEEEIAEGTVTSEIAARSCWIVVDDPEAVRRIREGDVAKLVIKDYSSVVWKMTSW